MMRRSQAAKVAAIALAAAIVFCGLSRAEPDANAVRVEPRDHEQLDQVSLGLVRKARAAERRRDYLTALQFMQMAATYLAEHKRWNFALWDDLASLHCKFARAEQNQQQAAASRASGRAMLGEFKCALDIWTHKRRCRLPWGRLERHPDSKSRDGPYFPGEIPNPAATPLCFRTLCGTPFGTKGPVEEDELWGTAMEAEPPPSFVSGPIEDAEDLPKIERLCGEQGGEK
jgi:hypothetical protein